MSNKKQSSIEWLECELKKIPFIDPIKAFEQAKQMEKQQIKDAFDKAYPYDIIGYDAAEQYYNETFNQ